MEIGKELAVCHAPPFECRCSVLYSIIIIYCIVMFKKQMLQAANTDLFNPLVPKDHNSECQNLLLPLQIKPVK